GVLLDQRKFVFTLPPTLSSEFLTQFLLQYYSTVLDKPSEILIPETTEDIQSVKEILNIPLFSPERGEKAKMVALAMHNAKSWISMKAPEIDLSAWLQKKLKLAELPRRIECVDISNLQGKEAVGSLVCFEDGKPLKSRYRKFRIRLSEGPNDYAMMFEVLSRRFKRALIAKSPEEKQKWSPPDLLMVDGGKGQLNIAQKALADLGMHILPIIAIAKPKEGEKCDKIFIPGRKNPLPFKPRSKELLYLTRIRDEAHRFGIAYHRHLRSQKFSK
ncbi:MAG: excinuclease ABC subunit C, partial [Deltaproteobacteria bacterium]|nr:excinuclease ABC subunit C [Deltaproteobacteria bacterium]